MRSGQAVGIIPDYCKWNRGVALPAERDRRGKERAGHIRERRTEDGISDHHARQESSRPCRKPREMTMASRSGRPELNLESGPEAVTRRRYNGTRQAVWGPCERKEHSHAGAAAHQTEQTTGINSSATAEIGLAANKYQATGYVTKRYHAEGRKTKPGRRTPHDTPGILGIHDAPDEVLRRRSRDATEWSRWTSPGARKRGTCRCCGKLRFTNGNGGGGARRCC